MGTKKLEIIRTSMFYYLHVAVNFYYLLFEIRDLSNVLHM